MSGILARFAAWALDDRRASYGLAVMRITIGGMTALTLLMYGADLSYSFGAGSRWGWSFSDTSAVNNYPWPLPFPFSREQGDDALLLQVIVLVAVSLLYALGWRMRIISPLFVYLWLGFSTLNPAITNGEHYQTFRVMIVFLLFADLSRRWSLDSRRRTHKAAQGISEESGWLRLGRWGALPRWSVALANNAAVVLVGAQLCIIYVSSALWKLRGDMWIDGIAVYYPLRVDELSLFPWLNELAWSIPLVVYVGTYLAVYLQLIFPLMLLHRWTRIVGLIGITGMHAAIGILLAIPLFSILMIASDAIFIRETSWALVRPLVRRWYERARAWVVRVLRLPVRQDAPAEKAASAPKTEPKPKSKPGSGPTPESGPKPTAKPKSKSKPGSTSDRAREGASAPSS